MSINPRVQSKEQRENQLMHFDIGRIYTAKIKDNREPGRNGALKVWIKESQFDETNAEKWITVRYAPPFWGTTPDNRADGDSFETTKKSYGMWFIPPDLGNYVLVCFINNNDAFWFASVPEAYINNMVPGIPSESTFASSSDLPTAEYNRVLTDGIETKKRPAHDPLVNGLLNQGLISDFVRGQSTSSARREAPSRVQGILTPRGSQLVMDDGWLPEELPDGFKTWLKAEDRNGYGTKTDHRQPGLNPANRNYTKTGERHDEFIRFRTRTGSQILISETYGHLYFITRDGESWMELNNDGNIDIYGTGSINFHAETDFNIRADRDVNIESGRNINIKAAGDHSSGTGDIKIESVNHTDFVIGGNQFITVTGKIHTSAAGEYVQQSGTGMHLNSGTVMNLSSSANTNIRAGGDIIESGTNIHMNGPVATPANSADPATAPTTNTGVNIKQRTGIADPANNTNATVSDRTIDTISGRVPTHEPWVGREYENPTRLIKPKTVR